MPASSLPCRAVDGAAPLPLRRLLTGLLRGLLTGLLGPLLLVLVLVQGIWAGPAWGLAEPASSRGAQLFELHCAGCHAQGGNIIRRGKTLKLAALQRQNLASPEAIAQVAAAGIGQMGGYGTVLGEGGPAEVATWVWQQAQAGWPRG